MKCGTARTDTGTTFIQVRRYEKVYIFRQNALAQLLAYYLHTENKSFDGFVLNEKYLGEKELLSDCEPVFSIESVIAAFGSEKIAVYLPVDTLK